MSGESDAASPPPPQIVIRQATADFGAVLEYQEQSPAVDQEHKRFSLSRRLTSENVGQIPEATPILPKTPKLSIRSDDLEELVPLTIRCTLKVSFDRVPIETDEVSYIEWYRKEAYESLNDRASAIANIRLQTPENRSKVSYIRHGYFIIRGHGCESEPVDLDEADHFKHAAQMAIMGFIQEHKFKKFELEVSWDYSALQLDENIGPEFTESMLDEMEQKMLTNFKGQRYIPRKDLERLTDLEIIEKMVHSDTMLRKLEIEEKNHMINRIQLYAAKLAAVCVFSSMKLSFLQHLMDEHNAKDDEPPKSLATCSLPRCRLKTFVENQRKFFAHSFSESRPWTVLEDHVVMPIHYIPSDKKRALLGFGAYSHVYRVVIDPVHNALPGVSQDFRSLKA